jgi:hypothetical protein
VKITSGRSFRWPAVLALWGAAAFLAQSLDGRPNGVETFILAAALTAGGLMFLPLPDGPGVPLGRALLLPLAASLTAGPFLAVVAGAELATLLMRPPAGAAAAGGLFVRRLAGAASGWLAYHVVSALPPARGWSALLACTAAMVAMLAVDEFSSARGTRFRGWSADRLQADIVVLTTGTLMALAYGRPDGGRSLGLTGLALLALPLLIACHSFSRLDHMRRISRQTFEALSTVTELGGWAPAGHAAATAATARALGRQASLSPDELLAVERAALLHGLGRVCLDEVAGQPPTAHAVAEAGARMLRRDPNLERVAELVMALGHPAGRPEVLGTAEEVLITAHHRHHGSIAPAGSAAGHDQP